MNTFEIDRLKAKARAGEPLTAREGLWLVEKVNQLRFALAGIQGAQHPALMFHAKMEADAALIAAALIVGEKEPPRGNQEWAEWGLNEPAPNLA